MFTSHILPAKSRQYFVPAGGDKPHSRQTKTILIAEKWILLDNTWLISLKSRLAF
jgi:hypothetical protein